MPAEKTIKCEVRQTPDTFIDERGKDISYMSYYIVVNGQACRVKPVNAEAKVYLKDAFKQAK